MFDSCAVAWRGGGLALARGASAPFFFGTQFAVQNRRKSLLLKDLGPRGGGDIAVSPYTIRVYVNLSVQISYHSR